jgi:hypothetical protein
VAPHDFSHAPPDTIAHYRPANGLFDAKAKAALRHLIRAKENSEVGIRAAFAGAVHSIKFSPLHQSSRAGKLQAPRFTQA